MLRPFKSWGDLFDALECGIECDFRRPVDSPNLPNVKLVDPKIEFDENAEMLVTPSKAIANGDFVAPCLSKVEIALRGLVFTRGVRVGDWDLKQPKALQCLPILRRDKNRWLLSDVASCWRMLTWALDRLVDYTYDENRKLYCSFRLMGYDIARVKEQLEASGYKYFCEFKGSYCGWNPGMKIPFRKRKMPKKMSALELAKIIVRQYNKIPDWMSF